MPRDRGRTGARARLGDHPGGKIAGRDGAVWKAFGEAEGCETSAATEVEQGPIGQVVGEGIEEMPGDVLQVNQPSLVVVSCEPVVASRHVRRAYPPVQGEQTQRAQIEPSAIHIAPGAHGGQTGPQPEVSSMPATIAKIQTV